VARGYLNVQIGPIDKKSQAYYGLADRRGALVQKVNEGGPAARAGMEDGDIIVSVDGKTIDGTEDLIQMISSHRPGETVSLGVLRDGKDVTLKVKLADRAETFTASTDGDESEGEEGEVPKPEAAAKLGLSVSELNPSLFRELYANQFELPRDHPDGVMVTKVSNQGPAYETGLLPGNIITHVGRTAIRSVSDFRRATSKIEKGQVVRLTVAFYTRESRTSDFELESRFVFIEAE
jgi:serine protease Do